MVEGLQPSTDEWMEDIKLARGLKWNHLCKEVCSNTKWKTLECLTYQHPRCTYDNTNWEIMLNRTKNTTNKIKSTNQFMYTNYECTPHLQGCSSYERKCVQIRIPHSWIAWSMTMSMLVTEYFIHSQTIMQTWRLFGWGEVIDDFLPKLAKLEPSKFVLLSSY